MPLIPVYAPDKFESERNTLRIATDNASNEWNAFIASTNCTLVGGLVPDKVRAMPEYDRLRIAYHLAFNKLRDFNSKNKPPKRIGYKQKD